MENLEMMKFFEEKEKYQNNGFAFYWIFEALFLDELQKLYSTKMVKLEEKLKNFHIPEEIGNFLMSAFTQKNFEEPLIGVKIVHVATKNGFSREEIVLIEEERTDTTKQQKSQRFIETFKSIISNIKLIPDKSVILLSPEQHKVIESGGKLVYLKENKTPSKIKKLKKVSEVMQL